MGGAGRRDGLSHWATSSGGTTTYAQVPQSTGDVHFNANAFTASGQAVTIGATVTCQSLNWTGAVHTPAGGGLVSGMRPVGSGPVNVNGDRRLPTLATNVHFDANSFGAGGQPVTLDGPNAFYLDMDWTGLAPPTHLPSPPLPPP